MLTRIFQAFDLCGSDGRLSFQKAMLIAVLAAGIWSQISTTLAIAVIAASFGRTVFMGFINRSTFDVREQITRTLDNSRTDDER